MKQVEYTASARRSLRELPAEARERLIDRLAWYAATGAGDVRVVAGAAGRLLRSGDYRIVAAETDASVHACAVGHRRNVYRREELAMGKAQFISTESGEELVILGRSDYDALRARAGDEAAEDAIAAGIVAESDAAISRGHDVVLPEKVWQEIEGGARALKVLRRHRGLTQGALAAVAGIAPAYLSEIERGRKVGAPETLKAIARALGVPLDLLVE